MHLLALPREILLHISDVLRTEHIPSLKAFSLISKPCHSIAVEHLFSTITLTLTCVPQAHDLAARWDSILTERGSHTHVHNLNLRAGIRLEHERSSRRASNEDDKDEVDIFDWVQYTSMPRNMHWIGTPDKYQLQAWEPIIALVCALPNLRNMTYFCSNPVPHALLAVLQDRPRCRLDVKGFGFVKPDHQHDRSPYELALFESPALRSVDFKSDSEKERKIYLTALTHLPSSVDEVSFRCPIAGATWTVGRPSVDNPLTSYVDWLNRLPERGDAVLKLKTLKLEGRYGLESPDYLETWSKSVDFTLLQTLDLKCWLQHSHLNWLRSYIHFKSLRKLSLHYVARSSGEDQAIISEDDYALEAFIRVLPPLSVLRLYGQCSEIAIKAIVERHGCSLQHLVLASMPTLSRNSLGGEPIRLRLRHFEDLANCCLLLHTLECTISRTQGDADEVAIYRATGRIPKLQYLKLHLDCSSIPSIQCDGEEDTSDSEDPEVCSVVRPDIRDLHLKPIRRSNYHKTLVNSAVDQPLARSIWQLLSTEVLGEPHLNTLTLLIEECAVCTHGVSKALHRELARVFPKGFEISRSVRDDRPDDFDIVEPGLRQRQRELRDQRSLRGSSFPPWGNLEDELYALYRRLWPPRDDSLDWREDWYSFALDCEHSVGTAEFNG